MGLLGALTGGASTLLGSLSGGIEKGANFLGLTTVDPQVQAYVLEQRRMEEEKKRQQEAMAAFIESQQGQQMIQQNPQLGAMLQYGLIGADDFAKTMVGGQNKPSAIQEWESFSSMSPEDQQRYLTMKRSNNPVNMGGYYGGFDPVTQTINPIAGGQKTLAPNETLGYKYGASAADTQGAQDVRALTEPGIALETTRAKYTGEAEGKKLAEAPGKVAESIDTLKDIDQFMLDPSVQNIYGSFAGLIPSVKQPSVDAERLRDKVAGQISLGARGKIAGQGPITEGDQKLLDRAVSIIADPRISYEMAMDEAAKAKAILERTFISNQEILGAAGAGKSPVPPSGNASSRLDELRAKFYSQGR